MVLFVTMCHSNPGSVRSNKVTMKYNYIVLKVQSYLHTRRPNKTKQFLSIPVFELLFSGFLNNT
jgi:hypothetical protein